jgi:hypothetical protein
MAESLLAGWGGRSYAVPIWFKKAKIKMAALGGESYVMCDTANKGFKIGDLCVIWQDADNNETHEISNVENERLTFVYPLSRDYPYGYCVPAKLCHLDGNSTSIGSITTNLIEADLTFEADKPETIDKLPSPDQYEGLSVFTWGHDYTKPNVRTLVRSMDYYDSGLSLTDWADKRGYPIDEVTYSGIMLMELEQIAKLKGFIASLDAQAKAFYLILNEDQLLLSRNIDKGSYLIYVKNLSYGLLEQAIKSRQKLVLYTKIGRVILNVNSYLSTDQGDVILFTDHEWEDDLAIEDVIQITFMVKVRLNQDSYVYEYDIDNVATISLKMKGVIN